MSENNESPKTSAEMGGVMAPVFDLRLRPEQQAVLDRIREMYKQARQVSFELSPEGIQRHMQNRQRQLQMTHQDGVIT